MKTHTKSDATHKLDRPLWVYSSGRSDACSICDMRLGKIHTPSHTHTHRNLHSKRATHTELHFDGFFAAAQLQESRGSHKSTIWHSQRRKKQTNKTERKCKSSLDMAKYIGSHKTAHGDGPPAFAKKKKQKYYHKWMVIWCSSGGVEMKAIYVWPPCTFVQHTNNGTKRVTSEFPRF